MPVLAALTVSRWFGSPPWWVPLWLVVVYAGSCFVAYPIVTWYYERQKALTIAHVERRLSGSG